MSHVSEICMYEQLVQAAEARRRVSPAIAHELLIAAHAQPCPAVNHEVNIRPSVCIIREN